MPFGGLVYSLESKQRPLVTGHCLDLQDPLFFSRLALPLEFSVFGVNQGTQVPVRQQWRMTVPGGLRGHQQGHMGGGLWSFLNVSFLPSTQEIREPAGGEVVPCGRPARRRSRLGHSQKAQSLNGHTEKVLTGKTFSISSLTRLSQPAPCPCPWSSSQTRPTVAQEIKSKRLRYRRQVALS